MYLVAFYQTLRKKRMGFMSAYDRGQLYVSLIKFQAGGGIDAVY